GLAWLWTASRRRPRPGRWPLPSVWTPPTAQLPTNVQDTSWTVAVPPALRLPATCWAALKLPKSLVPTMSFWAATQACWCPAVSVYEPPATQPAIPAQDTVPATACGLSLIPRSCWALPQVPELSLSTNACVAVELTVNCSSNWPATAHSLGAPQEISCTISSPIACRSSMPGTREDAWMLATNACSVPEVS